MKDKSFTQNILWLSLSSDNDSAPQNHPQNGRQGSFRRGESMVYTMEITDVKIRRTFETAPLRAVASVTFDDQFAVHDIKVIEAQEKLFIVMPSRKNGDGTYRDIAHPINAPFRHTLEHAVLDAYRHHADEGGGTAAGDTQSPFSSSFRM